MYKLQFITNPNRSLWLVGEKITLGCHSSNDVVLDGLGIKEHHAEILIEADHLILKSVAGSCYINDLPVEAEYPLQAKDELRIGKERLLITDPKEAGEPLSDSDSGAASEKSAAELSGWSLLPDHPKLEQSDFCIAARSVIGRSKDCEFSVPYKLLSREHAELKVQEGELLLTDLDSANGCFVNGKRVDQAKLNSGDKVAFAKLAFTVVGPEVEPTQKAELPGEELNRTIVRPAIDVDVEMQRAEEVASMDLLLEIDDCEEAFETTNKPGRGRKLVIAIVLIVVTAAALWFSPLAASL
ncbi:MAG: FHA domain-containing protein [Pseudomonadales bacterium]